MGSAKNGCEEVAFVAVILVILARFVLFRKRFPFIYHAKFGLAYFLALVGSAIWAPIFFLRPRDVRNLKYMWPWTRFVGWAMGVEYSLRGEEILKVKRPAVVVCNHQSTLDLISLIKLSEPMDRITAVAKMGLLYIFPFGPCCWLVGVLFINRHNPVEAYKVINQAKDWACKIWFFPEGTRNHDVNRTRTLLPFKRGAFKIAIDCQLPIIPIVQSPYYFVNKSRRLFEQGTVIQQVLEPIETNGLTEADVDSLMEKTWNIMQEKYKQLFHEVTVNLPKDYEGLL